MSLQTPLARVRGLGSAKEGVHHWWHQRLTGLALAPLSLWLITELVSKVGASHEAVVQWLRLPYVSVLMIIFLGSLFYHAQLGLQVVIEDYIDNEGQKIACIVLVKFLALLAGLASLLSVLYIFLGYTG